MNLFSQIGIFLPETGTNDCKLQLHDSGTLQLDINMLIAKHLKCSHVTEEDGANFCDDQKCLQAIKAVAISNDH